MFVFTYAVRPHNTFKTLNKYKFRMGSCNVPLALLQRLTNAIVIYYDFIYCY
jgi:hypothetical protein